MPLTPGRSSCRNPSPSVCGLTASEMGGGRGGACPRLSLGGAGYHHPTGVQAPPNPDSMGAGPGGFKLYLLHIQLSTTVRPSLDGFFVKTVFVTFELACLKPPPHPRMKW